MAFYFVSTFATAQTQTKQWPYGYRGLPALAFALHGWQAGLSEENIPAYKQLMALEG
ncbi:hypothetical protein BAZMOX_25926_1 [methanotrophic endosymbiont of Bathymodiolus azoricus (Menez Gwen)]|nr:hypothetical protein BAZMOX_25926_1 [methanotrophic endosymbiont of Bathymodiolus azoricus (Menez Gwen)]